MIIFFCLSFGDVFTGTFTGTFLLRFFATFGFDFSITALSLAFLSLHSFDGMLDFANNKV